MKRLLIPLFLIVALNLQAQHSRKLNPIINHSEIKGPVVKTKLKLRPDVCKFCQQDTSGGYTSIEDTILHNPICNYELLTNAHLLLTHSVKIARGGIPFFPSAMNTLYKGSGDSRGHCIPYEDLGYSLISATASMDLNRNLAPQPQNENIGTKLACENYTRAMALQFGSVKAYGGTFGTVGIMKGINKPSVYWTIIVEPNGTVETYWMPTTGLLIKYADLPACKITLNQLVLNLKFDPIKLIAKN